MQYPTIAIINTCRGGFDFFPRLFALLFVFLGLTTSTFAIGIPQQCGNDADADIVIMIDMTGSIDGVSMIQQKLATKSLLDFFQTAVIKPRVAIGTFNVVDGAADARILPGGNLTTTYGNDNPGATGLYAVVNNIPTQGNGWTDLSAALVVAQAELAANAQSLRRYIVVVSDGITNRPSGGAPNSCSGGNPGNAATAAADAAEAAGTQIFAIRFGTDSGCPVGTGEAFLRDVIATAPSMYYEGNGDLSGVFEDISQALVCDDGNPCTIDTCDNGVCVFTPTNSQDSDGDGIPDCQDKCPGGDDTVVGDVCFAGVGACANEGRIICRCNGNPMEPGTSCITQCNIKAGQPEFEQCDGIDNDCDELIDEDFPVGQTCMVGTGVCVNTGQFICTQDGEGTICNVEPLTGIFDECGVECGDGSTCVTPTPSPTPECEGVIDECGVCNGDGSSCQCEEQSLAGEILAIDSSFQSLFKIGKFYGNTALKIVKNGGGKQGLSFKKAKKIVKKNVQLLNNLNVESWTTVNVSLDSATLSCGEAFECATISSVSTLGELNANGQQMFKLIKQIRKKLGVGKVPSAKVVFKAAKKIATETTAAVNAYPLEVTNCEPIL